MPRVTVVFTIDDEEYSRFATTDQPADESLEDSVVARLDELYDDDGNPVAPKVLDVSVEVER